MPEAQLATWNPSSEQNLMLGLHQAIYNLAGDRVLTGQVESWVPNQEEATRPFIKV